VLKPRGKGVAMKSSESSSVNSPKPEAIYQGNGAVPPTSASPFDDMEALRKSNKEAFEGEKEGAAHVDLGKPRKELYVRFHEDDSFYLPSYVWAQSDDSRVMYYVVNNLWNLEDLVGGLRAVILAPWLGADGSLGLWPASASSTAGKWYDSAQEVLSIGRKEWVRLQTDNKEKQYRYFLPKNPLPEKEWPRLSFGEICKRAFGSRVVASEDHELIRKLRNA